MRHLNTPAIYATQVNEHCYESVLTYV